MSYKVLARKWRPKTFKEVVGQEHVVKALINTFDQQRLHHAYLFTGTRGVGKTTIARIIAKCLNCEKGVTSDPCDICAVCQSITEGHFPDLIEVDAASRTRVEETRELLDNVQYAPVQGRFKLYLIDEVHMLSGHSFNALLKTLEEPPAHVKFLLATTDPQRLPITVLSRCLQFHLKCLTPELIHKHLQSVLNAENISFENEALSLLAHAANGSARDALSLLDQAIAYSAGSINTCDMRAMLGTIEKNHVFDLLEALFNQDAAALIAICDKLAELATDFSQVLEELLLLFHHIALMQFIPDALSELPQTELITIRQYSQKISKEIIQLYYQIGLMGRRDLPLAPSLKNGFEMILLRMLAFEPVSITKPASSAISSEKLELEYESTPEVVSTLPETVHQWQTLINSLNLTGMTKELAQCCMIKKMHDTHIELLLDPKHEALLTNNVKNRLQQTLTEKFNKTMTLTITLGDHTIMTPEKYQQLKQSQQLNQATEALTHDPYVQNVLETFDGRLQQDSIFSKSAEDNS